MSEVNIAWLEIADSPHMWRKLGYVVDSSGICVIGGIQHRLVGQISNQKGLVRWALSGVGQQTTSIDGIPTKVVATSPQLESAAHPNGVTDIDHLVVQTSDTPRTVSSLEAIGLERRGHNCWTSSGEAVDMTFFWIGGTLLEIVGPPTPNEVSKPARFMGIAYVCEDLDDTAEYLGDWCSKPKAAVQPGRRISALTSKAGSSLPMAFMTPHSRTIKD